MKRLIATKITRGTESSSIVAYARTVTVLMGVEDNGTGDEITTIGDNLKEATFIYERK